MSDKPDQRSKIGEWIGAAFDAMLRPPQQWEGSIHMAWGAIDRRAVQICRKSRTDGIDGIIRDLEAAGFRAYYDRMTQCIEVVLPEESCETAGNFLERVTGIPSATMPTDVAAELATIASETLKEIGDER